MKASGERETLLYYRRGGRRIPLPLPEGSALFLAAYRAAEQSFEPAPDTSAHTVSAAITAYLASADFSALAPSSKRDYTYYLTNFSTQFGALAMASLDAPWLEGLRDKHAEAINQWNALRARMIAVTDHFMRRNPGVLPANHWRLARRLKTKPSDANKPWPLDVLQQVFAAATPEFRALLVAYLLTAQRGSDVTAFTAEIYDPHTRTLTFRQKKTDEPMMLRVPDALAVLLTHRTDGSLLLTPRGKSWKLPNAQETLKRLLERLALPRYTLHGLRSTGPSALRERGMGNAHLRAVTGHTTDSNLEVYLRHAARAPLAEEALKAMGDVFAKLLIQRG